MNPQQNLSEIVLNYYCDQPYFKLLCINLCTIAIIHQFDHGIKSSALYNQLDVSFGVT